MNHLRDIINWGPMITPTSMFLKSGAVMASIRYLPRDMASTKPQEMAAADEALNRVLMRFGSNWSLWFELQRNPCKDYSYHEYENPVSRAIERDRQRYFTTPGNQYENIHVLSLMYKPQVGKLNRLSSLYKDKLKENSDVALWLGEYKTFLNEFRSTLGTMKQFMKRTAVLDGDALATYLHNCVSIHAQNVKMPDLPNIDSPSVLDCDLTGGYEPMLGSHHLRTIKISGQPIDYYTSGILDIINNAPFPLRKVDRYQPVDRKDAEAEIEKTSSLWDAATGSLVSLLKSSVKNNDAKKLDAHAVLSSLETSSAMVALKSGRTGFGRLTSTITVHHPDLAEIERRCDWLTDHIRDAGFTCYVARDFDAVPAFMSSLPGHPKPDPGKLFAASINVAKLAPSTAPFTGPVWDETLDAPPILHCCGLGNTEFRLALHQPGTKVPHMVVDASTGAGKSTLMGALAFGHGKYRGSNVVFIDFLASAKGVTLALDGTFYGFEAGKKISLQPLRGIDNPKEMSWAVQFMTGFFRHLRVKLTTLQTQEIKAALDILATRPPHRRTFTNLQMFIQDQELWDALDVFVKGGAYGDLMDNETHSLGGNERVRCYEMEPLLKNEDAFGPVLYVIFHEIQRQLNGDPMFLVVDEAQHLKRFEIFRDYLAEYLETGRKNGMAVCLITPNLKEFTQDEKLSALIARSCKTRLFGSNPAAMSNEEDYRAYKSFGLTDERIAAISKLKTATAESPDHWYAFAHENGDWALFDAKFSKMQLAFFGRNSPEDKAAMDVIYEAEPRASAPQRWLKYCGFSDEEIIEFGFALKLGSDYYTQIAAE